MTALTPAERERLIRAGLMTPPKPKPTAFEKRVAKFRAKEARP